MGNCFHAKNAAAREELFRVHVITPRGDTQPQFNVNYITNNYSLGGADLSEDSMPHLQTGW